MRPRNLNYHSPKGIGIAWLGTKQKATNFTRRYRVLQSIAETSTSMTILRSSEGSTRKGMNGRDGKKPSASQRTAAQAEN